mmetsp:Transcript_31655/g.51090  ORF Transcript_31655/g.51090 Transcript_31655/m.51090 type:complete len:160 (+) Transcript_31655:61-540(+)
MRWQNIRSTLGIGLQIGSIAYVFRSYVGQICLVDGPSMIPTLNERWDMVLVDCLSPRVLRRPYQVGDVVVSISPCNPRIWVCKRILGMPGDRVYPEGNVPVKVPPGMVWIQGDNSDNSMDSRKYGPVPMALLQGRALVRVWPPSQIGFIPPLKDARMMT